MSQYLGPQTAAALSDVGDRTSSPYSPRSSLSHPQPSTSPSSFGAPQGYETQGHQRHDTMVSLQSVGYAYPGQPYGGPIEHNPALQHVRSGSNTSHLSPHSRHMSMTLPSNVQSHSRNASGASAGSGTLSFAFNPHSYQSDYYNNTNPGVRYSTYGQDGYPQDVQRTDTMRGEGVCDPSTGYFNDFTAHGYDPARESTQYGRPVSDFGNQPGARHRYPSMSAGDGVHFSPTAAMAPPMLTANDLPSSAVVNHLLPLEPRDIPFAVLNTHNSSVQMPAFNNIASVLRHRARTFPKSQAYMVLDAKGKEFATCSWDKLASRAEKVAQVIKDKSNLYTGDRVALLYRDIEVIDFAVALLGCFIAGVVAVPINALDDNAKLNYILTNTQAHLALTTDYNLKAFQRDLVAQKLNWPRGVEWWKTNEFGAYNPKKKDDVPALQVPDLAYIEFSRAPTGDLRGVAMSHRTIMHQMETLSAIISSAKTKETQDTFSAALKDKVGKQIVGGAGETLVTYLDPRQQIGMILGILLNVFGGHTTVWCHPSTVATPGLYAHVLTKYKATLVLADYPGLKAAAFNYQQDPFATREFTKKMKVDFSNIKLCMIDSLTVDAKFHEILADRWLRPLGNTRAREVVAPMLCLPEHGGMVIAMRDWLGGEERMGCPLKLELPVADGASEDGSSDSEDESEKGKKKEKSGETPVIGTGYSSLLGGSSIVEPTPKVVPELGEVLLDKEALKTNEVQVVAMGNEARKRAGAGDTKTVRIGAFGYPIPDATLAVVDPETSLLCTPNVIGEIWVDSPSLSAGFWAQPKHTETIFHARSYKFESGDPTPTAVEPEFLRTGLLGCVIEGKVYVLGLYEDRLRQRVEWVEDVAGMGEDAGPPEYRYYFVQHLIVSMMKNIPKIFDSSGFDVLVNNEHLPIILMESHAASTAPQSAGGPPRQLDTALLESLSERCMEVLLEEHHLRVFCVMITAPHSLPRVWKNGRKEIGNMLCRKEFDQGTLPCVHVKFGVERAVLNLPIGVDPVGGIWSTIATQSRQEHLMLQEKQYSGVDHREVVIDDRTSTPLNHFSSIVDLLQWRVMRQADELSYCSIDNKGKEGKGITWRKLDTKIAAVAACMKNKWKLKAGDHAILMYTHSEEFVFAVHACFCLGVIAIPSGPLDQNRLGEDCPALLHMVKDFDVKAILVNNEVDHLLKLKLVVHHLKQVSAMLRTQLPPVHNSTKPAKQNLGCRDLGFTMNPGWVDRSYTALVWTYWTPDQRRIAVSLGHKTIMGMCKVQKETCQMTSSRPVLGCVRSTSGLGFIHTCLMGVFVGAPTYMVSPVDFAQNPMSLFLTLSRYKIKDTYATPQMLDHGINTMPAKGFTLHELKDMMISFDGRPRTDIFQRVRLHFAGAGLDRTAINTVYSHVLNPMIASRSYMCIEPIELWLDPKALRAGLVYQVDPETNPNALLVQDSGMVPVSTKVAIVNPETRYLCHTGEYGEIWVESEACVNSFYRSMDPFDAERFSGKTMDGDQRNTYVRTGDLGFLHTVNRPIGPGGGMVEMQILFVLGAIGETFEVNGLSHFPMDIEASVERCHRNICNGGSAVFQAGGLVVVLVEVLQKAYLASMVPVIVNAILDEHQLVVDIVAFVAKGDFPRSRLGEKQRGRILAGWVGRKLRTIAQFGIRDVEGTDNAGAQQSPAKSPSIQASINPGRATPTQLATVPSNTLDPYSLPASIPENEQAQYPRHYSLPLHLEAQPEQEPQVLYEMPAHNPMSPIELPTDFGTIETSVDSTEDKESSTPPKIRYTLHAPSFPPVINTAYGDVSEGNPYADDDSMTTPTPTQEGRNGMKLEGAGYIESYHPPACRAPQGEVGETFLNDALLQLRFVDDAEGEGGQAQSNARGGFGTAL